MALVSKKSLAIYLADVRRGSREGWEHTLEVLREDNRYAKRRPITLTSVLTSREVGFLLRMSREDFTAACRAGLLPAEKVNGRWTLRFEALRTWVWADKA